MTDTEVLQIAITKAVKNGYTAYFENLKDIKDEDIRAGFLETVANELMKNREPNTILFDHSFAKAFWGEEEIDEDGFTKKEHLSFGFPEENWHNKGKAWQHHLQQMVLETNPIDYLRQFVEQEGRGK